MPQIETWSHLPAAVRAHLVERMHDRKISLQDLNQLRVWIESKPNVPEAPAQILFCASIWKQEIHPYIEELVRTQAWDEVRLECAVFQMATG